MFSSLENPPDSRDLFLWTDYIEILAITHIDKCYSKGDLSSLSRRISTLKNKNDKQADRLENSYESLWADIINFAEIRKHSFGKSYPFSISDDKDTLSFTCKTLNDSNRAYIGLLLASSLRLIEDGRNHITSEFELAAFEIFKFLQPSGSQVWATGASNTITSSADDGSAPNNAQKDSKKLFDKMKRIAAQIRCEPNFKESDYNEKDVGDGGIDLIAWHPMGDDREGIPISFAQCGCSKSDWVFKQAEAHPSMHRRQLPVMHPWATYYFLPLDLRNPDGDYAKKSDIGEAIFVDRLRIIRLASQYKLLRKFPKMEYVKKALEYTNPNF